MDLAAYFKNGLELDISRELALEGVFEEVAGALARLHDLDAAVEESLRAAFLERERRGTTAFGFGIALPHIFHPALKATNVIAVRHEAGVEMGAMDGVRTTVMVCVAAPEKERETYLALLRHTAQVTRERRWRSFMLQSPTAAGILEVMIEAGEE